MRVVITGGSGLIGRALAADLAGAGRAVTVLSRRPDEIGGLPPGVVAAGWDGESATALAAAIDGADVVVHLAGENLGAGRWTAQRKRRIRASREVSTAAVAAAFGRAARPPAALVQASAVGFYGDRGDEELTEDSAAGEGFLAEVCRAWEAASASVEALGVRRALARSGVVLAREGGALTRMALPFRLFAGGPAGSGRQWLPWIHRADEVEALRYLIEDPLARGPFNLTAPRPLPNRDFSRALGRALRRPSLAPAPAFALRLLLGEMAQLLLGSQRALPRRLLAAGFRFRFPEAAGALAELFGSG